MSWLPAMMFMHMLDDDELDQPTQVDKSDDTHPVVNEIHPPVTDDTPASNSTECTPTVAPRSWHYTAMSAATFALSALMGYIATEAIFKRIRGRN